MHNLFRLMMLIIGIGLGPLFVLWLINQVPGWIWWTGAILGLLCRYPWLVLGIIVLDVFEDC